MTWAILAGLALIIAIAFLQTYLQERVRNRAMDKSMWDSRVQAWVADGVSKGYAVRAGAHLAYDGHTKVHTLVLQTTAVRKLHEPQPEETHGR